IVTGKRCDRGEVVNGKLPARRPHEGDATSLNARGVHLRACPGWFSFLRGHFLHFGLAKHSSSWQRCRVHFMRNLLSQVPKDAKQMVAAFVRTIFAQPDKAAAHAQLANVADSLEQRFPKAAEMLREAEEDILAY